MPGEGDAGFGLGPALRFWLENLLSAFADPSLLLWLGFVLALVYWQYRRLATLERMRLGGTTISPGRETFESLLAGLLGGMAGAGVLMLVGVSLLDAGILYLWPLALLLMFIHPRYLCFAYAGGLLATSHMLFGVPAGLEVASLAALVAVLHGIEATLIWLNGASHPQALYVRTPQGETVGGFLLQRAWPIPTLGLAVAFVTPAEFQSLADYVRMVPTPSWWPLIPFREAASGLNAVVLAIPLVAALGYSDLTITREPSAKARRSALQLGIYSLSLLGLAVLAGRAGWAGYLAAVAMPFGHELVILLGQRAETRGVPRFSGAMVGQGVGVLDVVPGSAAAAMGLRAGDRIVRANNEPVANAEALYQVLSPWSVGVTLEVERLGRRIVLSYDGKVPPLGLVPVPDSREARAVPLPEDTWIDGLLWLGRRLIGGCGGHSRHGRRPGDHQVQEAQLRNR